MLPSSPRPIPPLLPRPCPLQDLVQEVLSHLEVLSQHVALAAADVLMRMTGTKVMELMGECDLWALPLGKCGGVEWAGNQQLCTSLNAPHV